MLKHDPINPEEYEMLGIDTIGNIENVPRLINSEYFMILLIFVFKKKVIKKKLHIINK